MKKIKTENLIGKALDFAVFIAEGFSYWNYKDAKFDVWEGYTDWVLDNDGALKKFRFDESYSRAGAWRPEQYWAPSVEWDQGGPFIEKYGFCLLSFGLGDSAWSANASHGRTAAIRIYGPTPLVAAMRCYVASKLGDEVDIPEICLENKNK